MNASHKYKPYYWCLEVNFTIGDEEPPKIYFNTRLKDGRKM